MATTGTVLTAISWARSSVALALLDCMCYLSISLKHALLCFRIRMATTGTVLTATSRARSSVVPPVGASTTLDAPTKSTPAQSLSVHTVW